MCPIARRNSLSSFKKSHPRHSASSSTKAPTTSSESVDFCFRCSLFLHDPDQGLTKGALFSHVNWTESFWGTNHQPSSRCLSNTRNANEAGGHARRWVEHNTLTRAILMIYPLFLVERGLEPKDDQTEDTHTKASETTTSDEDYTRKLLISASPIHAKHRWLHQNPICIYRYLPLLLFTAYTDAELIEGEAVSEKSTATISTAIIVGVVFCKYTKTWLFWLS